MSYTSRELYGYLNQVKRCFTNGDGYRLSELVSLSDSHVRIMKSCGLEDVEESEKMCQQLFDSPFDEMIAAHVRCCCEYLNGNLIQACTCQMVVVQSFQKGFQSQKEENWALPVLSSVVLDLRLLAVKSDDTAGSSSASGSVSDVEKKDGDMLEKAADIIMSCFRVCISDSRTSLDNTKRWGTLGLVNQLFKIYFKINKLPLCKPLIRAIESSDIKNDFPVSHLVTYKFFVGRKSMFDGEFKLGATCLSYAFEHCHISSIKNKRLILTYLIPIKMMLGQMPKQELLDKYGLLQFNDVARAVCNGNLKMFSHSMKLNQVFFIKAGIYLILEKLKTVAIRNLFKKVWLIINSYKLDLKAFQDALVFNEEDDIDSDEVECITANLIDKGYIKGYISHQHQKLVVSKQQAFPSLSTVQH